MMRSALRPALWRGVFAFLIPVILWFALKPRLTFVGPAVLGGALDLSYHAAAFAALALAAGLGWRAPLVIAVALSLGSGAIELAQGLTPFREPALDDFLAGIVGVALGLGTAETTRQIASRLAP